MAKNYYVVLGLGQGASDQEIRDRFKKLARERHPDRFQGTEKAKAERAFQDLTEAYNVLTDPERRRLHDSDLATSAAPSAASADRASQDTNQAVRAYLARGVQSYKAGQYKAAFENFERACEIDPKSPQAWYNLALTCSRRDAWLRNGIDAIEKACEIEPMKVSYRKLAGRLCARAGRTSRAEEHFKQALAWGGSDSEVEQELDELRSGRSKGKGLFGKVI